MKQEVNLKVSYYVALYQFYVAGQMPCLLVVNKAK